MCIKVIHTIKAISSHWYCKIHRDVCWNRRMGQAHVPWEVRNGMSEGNSKILAVLKSREVCGGCCSSKRPQLNEM